MKIIQEPSEFAINLLGEQSYSEDSVYRLLYFCETVKEDNIVLIYNNLTKELIELNNEEFSTLEESNYNKPVELVNTLIKKYFLVPLEHNDLKLSDELRNMARLYEKNSGFETFTILTTTACNARCFYCFEAGASISTMSMETAKKVSDYIIEKRNKNKRIHIRWFGGEPLCNYAVIDEICLNLKDNKVNFVSDIVTNGYLINEDLIKKAVNVWNLKSAQITLDGYEETYNRIKNYKNNDNNAFNRVINNIELLIKNNIHVNIRLNMDMYNSDELFFLVDWINNRFDSKKYLSVYACPLFEDIEINSALRSDSDRKALTDKFIALDKLINDLGLKKTKVLSNKIKVRCCQADSDSSVLISPNGDLGRCEHFINDDFIGTIFDDFNYTSWRNYCESSEQCRTCSVYPTCIRLKECYSNRNICFDYEKYSKISSLRKSILETYYKFLDVEKN